MIKYTILLSQTKKNIIYWQFFRKRDILVSRREFLGQQNTPVFNGTSDNPIHKYYKSISTILVIFMDDTW